MTRRTIATLLAGMLTGALLIAAFWLPVPYVHFEPGGTVDLLSEEGGRERIEVRGAKAYSGTDEGTGELHMTTVIATPPRTDIRLAEALAAWASPDEAVKPYDNVYDDETTEEQDQQQAQLQMASSRDQAIAAALHELGHKFSQSWSVAEITRGAPADGALAVGDRVVSVGGTRTPGWEAVVEAVLASEVGEPLTLGVLREGRRTTVTVSPVEREGRPFVGIAPGVDYDFPFDVDIHIDENIGGPSAGLMFALAVVDTLTPGPLTGGARVAGTGTIDGEGNVGGIGGIQQKIVGARAAGAELFLAPAGNCEEAVHASDDGIRVVPVSTLEEARDAVTAYAEDPEAELPTCERVIEEAGR
jgi:PDZ domain-containing protein